MIGELRGGRASRFSILEKDGMADAGSGEAEAGLSIAYVSVEALKPYKRNPRQHPPEQIERLAGLIREVGWTAPILADEDGIIAGHGRHLAARAIYAAGERIRLPNGAQVPPGTVPVYWLSGLTGEQRRAYVIADNKLALESTWDQTLLNFELDALDEADFDIDLTGFADFSPKDAKGESSVKEVLATETATARFWISLRGPLADQARVLDAVKAALGEPGEVEIEIGSIEDR